MNLITKIKFFYRSAYQMGHFPPVLSVMFSSKKVFVYYGFLGDNNYGDELVYEATKEIFKGHILVPMKRRMPISLRLYLIFRKGIIKGIVIGGGTLISKFRDAAYFKNLVEMGKPVYLHGTGVHANIKDVNSWTTILNSEVFGGVRGPLSVKNLEQIRPMTNILGDAAFGIALPDKLVKSVESRKVLINLGTHANYEGQDIFRNVFNPFIEYLISNKYDVFYLPFHDIDMELGLSIKKTYPEVMMLTQPIGFAECSMLFADCTFAIGERLHFIVMAIMTSTPFTSINYAKKHNDLLLSLSHTQNGLFPEEASLERLIYDFNNRHTFEWKNTQRKIDEYRKLQINEMQNFTINS